MSTRPVLDIGPFLAAESTAAAAAFVDGLRQTLHGPGFCHLVGHGVDPDATIHSNYGDDRLRFRVRSHPDVAAIHHPDPVGRFG